MDIPDWCGQCNKRTRHMDTPQGPRRCAACHPYAGKHLAQFRTCPDCLDLIPERDRNPCGHHQPIPERRTA